MLWILKATGGWEAKTNDPNCEERSVVRWSGADGSAACFG